METDKICLLGDQVNNSQVLLFHLLGLKEFKAMQASMMNQCSIEFFGLPLLLLFTRLLQIYKLQWKEKKDFMFQEYCQ